MLAALREDERVPCAGKCVCSRSWCGFFHDYTEDLWTRSRKTTSLYQAMCFLLKLLLMFCAAAVAEEEGFLGPLKTLVLTL